MCLHIISVISWRLSHYRRSHRAAATALPPSRCALPPQHRRQAAANVALLRRCHRLVAAKLPPTSAFALLPTSTFALPPTSAFALPPPPQLPRCCRCRRAVPKLPLTSLCRATATAAATAAAAAAAAAAVRWLVVAL
jgi:hypothetical protein